MSKPLIFISYSHKNEKEKDELMNYLKFLENNQMAEIWLDDNIKPGGDWNSEIIHKINKANICVLLVTQDFLTSDFIINQEIPKMLERRKDNNLEIFPIIATHCTWKRIKWLNELNARPKNGEPIWDTPQTKNKELTEISDEIFEMLEKIPQDKFIESTEKSSTPPAKTNQSKMFTPQKSTSQQSANTKNQKSQENEIIFFKRIE